MSFRQTIQRPLISLLHAVFAESASTASSPLLHRTALCMAPPPIATSSSPALFSFPRLASFHSTTHASSATSTLKPPFVGGKLKPYSAYKNRFKMTGTGKIRCMRPGHVHKRFNKGRRQLADLSNTKVVDRAWERTMKKIGFVMRRFFVSSS